VKPKGSDSGVKGKTKVAAPTRSVTAKRYRPGLDLKNGLLVRMIQHNHRCGDD
jgi:hypothetical protein